MNMKRIFTHFALLAAAAFSFVSCKLDYDGSGLFYPNAIVTVKTAEDGTCFFQLTDEVAVRPVNITGKPFGGKEVRALVNITEQGASSDSRFDKDVKVNSIDSVRTKVVVQTLGPQEDAERYGEDPIEVIDYWVTGLEDGYLTLSFCGLWSDLGKVHSIDLVAGSDPENPDLYVLRHNAFDDRGSAEPYRMTGIIAFNLRDEAGEWPLTLTLKYASFSGEKAVEFGRQGHGFADGSVEAESLNAKTPVPVR